MQLVKVERNSAFVSSICIPVHISRLKLMELFIEFKLSPRRAAFYFASMQVLFTFYNWLLNQNQQLAIHAITENNSPSPSPSRGALLPYVEYACIRSRHHRGPVYLILLVQYLQKIWRQKTWGPHLIEWPWETQLNSSLVIFKTGIILALSISCKACKKEVCKLQLVVRWLCSYFSYDFFSFSST